MPALADVLPLVNKFIMRYILYEFIQRDTCTVHRAAYSLKKQNTAQYDPSAKMQKAEERDVRQTEGLVRSALKLCSRQNIYSSVKNNFLCGSAMAQSHTELNKGRKEIQLCKLYSFRVVLAIN